MSNRSLESTLPWTRLPRRVAGCATSCSRALGWTQKSPFAVRLFITFLIAGFALPGAASPALSQTSFPGSAWQFKSPAEVDMDAAKLDQIASIVGDEGCIVRNGYMVKTWGSQSARRSWASASKPVITTLLFFAIEEGRIPNVDAFVKDYGWTLISKDQDMTFRHMANMVGTYVLAEANGAVWAYSDYNIQLYQKTLFSHVYGQTPDAVALAASRLGALQFQDGSLFDSRAWVVTSVRDFARVGWFWLNRGNWNGVQLLPQHYFDDYMKPGVPPTLPKTSGAGGPGGDYLGIGSYGGGTDQTPYGPGIYGFNWWFNGMGGLHPTSKTWPDAPDDTIQANGLWNSQTCTIIPSRGLVMCCRRGSPLGSFQPGNAHGTMNQVLKLLKEASFSGPVISVSPSSISHVVHLGENASDMTLTVANAGIGTLQYRIETNQGWLSATPSNGSITTGQDTITLSFTTAGLPVDAHVAAITISDNGSSPAAENNPQTVPVTLTVKTVRPDFDHDSDVDQQDFGVLQACFTRTVGEITAGCPDTDMNEDDRVDGIDLQIFLACMSGPGLSADRTCDDEFEQ